MTSRQVKRIDLELGATAAKQIGKFQLVFHQVVSSATPVDEGTARSAWEPKVTTRTQVTVKAPASEEAAKAQAVARAAENQAKAILLSKTYKLRQGNVYISNTAAHIVPLNEDGTSAQAPAKFVERSISTAIAAAFKVRQIGR